MAIKQLASQTLWYGLSNVGARLISFLLTPILTYLLPDANGQVDYGNYSIIYAYIGILNIIFTYGLETGYFWLVNKEGVSQKSLFNTTLSSHLISTLILVAPILIWYKSINNFLELGSIPQVIFITGLIMVFDTLATIPFAQLRQDNRPKRYALVRILGILLNVALVIIFLYALPKFFANTENELLKTILHTEKLILIIFANFAQSLFTFLLLMPVWKRFRFSLNKEILSRILKYSLPMVVIGLGGMVNELIDRIMLDRLLPVSADEAKSLVGIYSANYKIAIFITLFIQAFKMAAEPFFFKQSADKNAPKTYAMVMKWFVVTLCVAFLFTIVYLDTIIYMISPSYRLSGFGIIPILLLANVFLGIYYNLSVWYKVSNQMIYGLIITLIGAVITVVLNYIFIPKYNIYAASTVTLICYFAMVVISYYLGQKKYPVPYNLKRIFQYLLLTLLLSLVMISLRIYYFETLTTFNKITTSTILGTLLLFVFLFFVMKKEKVPLGSIVAKIKKR